MLQLPTHTRSLYLSLSFSLPLALALLREPRRARVPVEIPTHLWCIICSSFPMQPAKRQRAMPYCTNVYVCVCASVSYYCVTRIAALTLHFGARGVKAREQKCVCAWPRLHLLAALGQCVYTCFSLVVEFYFLTLTLSFHSHDVLLFACDSSSFRTLCTVCLLLPYSAVDHSLRNARACVQVRV